MNRLDHNFTKDILEKLDKDVVTEDNLEKLLVIHMRKTSCVNARTIKVAEAPISRTHSLTDAIDPRHDVSINSAGSTISRKSEPDMRKWSKKGGLGSINSDDVWGEVEKYQRAVSILVNFDPIFVFCLFLFLVILLGLVFAQGNC